MSSSPVLLLFGSGPNTGLKTAKKFAKEGYKVAAVSRHPSAELKEVASLTVPADLTDPASVESVFEKVTKELGAPHVVIYNAYDVQMTPLDNPIQVSVTRLTETLAVNTVSPYAAAALAIKGWSSLPTSASKTFMFTGNMTNTQLYPFTHSLGIGKNATAYWLEVAANTKAYNDKNYNFYYVDERTEEGESTMQHIDGKAHAEEFWKLASLREQGHWCWTFVKGGNGYVRNHAAVDRELRTVDFPIPLPEGGVSMAEAMKMMGMRK